MPRTTTLESPGCPPLRALTFDSLGLIKVIECRVERGHPQVVDRWGTPDASKCFLAASIDDRNKDPLLAVARKCGTIEVINPLNGVVSATVSSGGGDDDGGARGEDDGVVGLHLLRNWRSSGSCKLLSCTKKGDARLRLVPVKCLAGDEPGNDGASGTWKACASGSIECLKVDSTENYAVFGGKGVEVNLWDLEKITKIWTAKSPPKNSLGIFTPTWFTSATFLTNDDHRKFVAGTFNHQVRLYDASAQRRPVMSFDFRETPIKAISEDPDGHTIYLGNGSGDLASVDIRAGKLMGCFSGKCCGSIRSIVRHPHLPVIASCGLDSYVRLWDIQTRQPLSAIFLKQHLTNVVFDSNFDDKEVAAKVKSTDENENEIITTLNGKRKEAPKEKGAKNKKTETNDGSESRSKKKC